MLADHRHQSTDLIVWAQETASGGGATIPEETALQGLAELLEVPDGVLLPAGFVPTMQISTDDDDPRTATTHLKLSWSGGNDVNIQLPLRFYEHNVIDVPHLTDRLTGDTCSRPLEVRAGPFRRMFTAFPGFLRADETDGLLAASQRYLAAVYLCDAVLVVVTGFAADGDDEARLLLPLIRRTRFLLLSHPFRDPSVVKDIIPYDGWPHLAFHARRARTAWWEDLAAHESLAILDGLPANELERELKLLVFEGVNSWQPLSLTTTGEQDSSGFVDGDRQQRAEHPANPDAAFRLRVAEVFLLPRFMLDETARALLPGERQCTGRMVVSLAVAALLSIAGVAAAVSAPWVAAGLAAVLLALLAAATIAIGPELTYLSLVRLPASAAVGSAILVVLNDPWWDTPPWSVLATVVLALTSLGYLVFEARNHGVDRRSALRRGVAVWTVGAGYAMAVSAVAVGVVASNFIDPTKLEAALATWSQRLAAVVMTAAFALSGGVLLQLLWDEHPVTAPLARIWWRSDTSG